MNPVEDDVNWNKLESVYFENLSKQPVELWVYNVAPGQNDIFVFVDAFRPDEKRRLKTVIGYLFYFTKVGEGGSRHNALLEVMMERNTKLVTLHEDHARKKKKDRKRFKRKYKAKTGRLWKNYWPREPVMYHYHNVTKGKSIERATDRSQFHLCSYFDGALSDEEVTTCTLEAMTSSKTNKWDRMRSFQMENDRFFIGRINETNYCRRKGNGSHSKQMVSWNITNICDKGPNVFRIFDFLSDDEMDHIKNIGHHIGLKRSVVGESRYTINECTSQNAWIPRHRSFIVDNIIRRIADMVQIPQQRLFRNASSEALQLVHYFEGEMYKYHHDYMTGSPHSRYITVIMYLNEVKEGGYTSFPMADASCKNEEGYFGVQPIKGSVAFFYNLLSDGNVDPKTLHQGEPPVESEKWMTNLWIWDKVFVSPIAMT